MNFNIVKKKNPNCVQIEWSAEVFDNLELSDLDLETIVLTLIDFENKKTVKDIVLVQYKEIPIHITINRLNIPLLLNYLLTKFTEKEKYEICHQINLIKYDNSK